MRLGIQDLGPNEDESWLCVCLVRDELDVKYYVNLWEIKLKRIYYGGDYHMDSPDPKIK